jgi:leucyl aminopeptidase (aminopeptidase T)
VDTAFIEVMAWATLAVERCVGVKPGEQCLILSDTRSQEYRGAVAFTQALMAAVHARGAEATLMMFTPRPSQVEDPPKTVATAMKAADVIFPLCSLPLTETEAMQSALDAGARALVFGGSSRYGKDDDMLYRLAPMSAEELDRTGGLAAAIGRAFSDGKRVHLTSERGTDLWLTVGDLEVITMDGRCDKPGMLQFYVPGLVNAGVTPGTTSGRLVFDTSLSPLGGLSDPVTLTIEDGFFTKVEGGREADTWRRLADSYQDRMVYNVSEFGLGANRRARLSGVVGEEEAAYGVAHVGFGTDIAFGGDIRAKWHVDGCLKSATIEVGGELICKDGEILLQPVALG